MSNNRSARKAKAFEDIMRLKANRRKDIIKCAAALAIVVILVTGKIFLEANGFLAIGNIAAGAVMMFSAIGLAILGGSSSLDFTRSGQQIAGICASTGITKEDIAEYERAQR